MNAGFSFARNAALAELGNVGQNLMDWYATKRPETASAADIAELKQRSDALAHRIAELEGTLEHDQHTLDDLLHNLERAQKASDLLGEKLKAAQESNDSLQITTLKTRLNQLLDSIEQWAGQDGTCNTDGQVFLAKKSVELDKSRLETFRNAHQQAVNDWMTADSRLRQARANLERAEQEKQIAQEQQRQAAADAGLLHGSRAGSVGLDAMERSAERARQDARAATIQTETLQNAPGGQSVDRIIQETLRDSEPAKPEGDATLDRLARLRGRAA